MSNLIKSHTIQYHQTKQWVVDSNSREELYQSVSFFNNTNTDTVEGGYSGMDPAFVGGLPIAGYGEASQEESQSSQEILNEASDTANQIIEEANTEAEKIISSAKLQAESVSSQIYDDAKQKGYQEGLKHGQQEIRQQEEELNSRINQNHKDYEEKLNQLEPMFVNLTAGLIEKLTGILVEDKKEVILHLMKNIISGSERSKVYVIKVSKDDFNYVESQMEQLESLIKSESTIELYEDVSLCKNQCSIETDGSVFDCGLGTQLEHLIEELKLLSLNLS